jgi:hypothetical protein
VYEDVVGHLLDRIVDEFAVFVLDTVWMVPVHHLYVDQLENPSDMM